MGIFDNIQTGLQVLQSPIVKKLRKGIKRGADKNYERN